MAALVQTYPQQTSTITMLQTRPSSNGGMVPASPSPGNHQYNGGGAQTPRSAYNSGNANNMRGSSVSAQTFGFSSTPNLASQSTSWQQYGTYRANPLVAVPGHQTFDASTNYRPVMHNSSLGYPNAYGMSYGGSRDDSALMPSRNLTPTARPHSFLSVATQPSFSTSTRQNGPDRYRRTSNLQPPHHGRSHSSTLQSSPSMIPPSQAYQASRRYSASNLSNSQGLAHVSSMGDLQQQKKPAQDDVMRLRRRSVHAIETQDATNSRVIPREGADNKQSRAALSNNHSRTASSESISSTRSSNSRPSSATNRASSNPTLSTVAGDEKARTEQHKSLAIPPRGSSSDVARRNHNPSPLSRTATTSSKIGEESSSAAGPAAAPKADSPAAKHLAALNQKGGKGKSKTSRLRRAFSFGSAAEFRKTAEDDGGELDPAGPHNDLAPEEAYDAEQARIAQAQEAGGIGNSIYGGRFFGSTDNLSISSTASSASIMIRKMGRGMKKSTRSFVGLFRPKSVIGVPAAEPQATEASQAAVSMVTVEAETQRVNVTADPHAAHGGTGFPRLERNSIDAVQASECSAEGSGASAGESMASRKSIVGGENERAEVLAAVRKGILKRSGSPSVKPTEGSASPDLVLPAIPAVADSPFSSAPSTPNDDAHGHKRTGSIAIGSEDYFMSALRLRQDSQMGTPTAKRNATFSPRLIFYDTWPSQEYDRRGEVATCNRLTPLLAQQIKEELNSFKMEMEVHENSKIYTHFF
ncbi:hypothetical protein AAL_00603 [Moelleriella libera RCEF 2490]|uniref:Immunoglobulin A1 protease n=1 Tax=Moelleriella libera RCEF 2490 TaxID=1081109 RepID=A0A166UZC2_9HYPO|nr:hypothetical protein AAL_00603 [Moelleriella libera RCEF 2490]